MAKDLLLYGKALIITFLWTMSNKRLNLSKTNIIVFYFNSYALQNLIKTITIQNDELNVQIKHTAMFKHVHTAWSLTRISNVQQN